MIVVIAINGLRESVKWNKKYGGIKIWQGSVSESVSGSLNLSGTGSRSDSFNVDMGRSTSESAIGNACESLSGSRHWERNASESQ
jgi:hypothetical protein